MKKYKKIILEKIFYKIINYSSIKKDINYLGTSYGGWYLIDENLNNNIILSAGVGEDISFDIEFINKYDGIVIFVDPTPRALEHLLSVQNSLGNKKTKEYKDRSGKQPIESYDLLNIKKENFIIFDKALSNIDGGKVKFFSPPNPEHVSHSISNWQNNFRKTGDYINVETTTVSSIKQNLNIETIDLIKLDIEGSENQVLPDLIRSKIFPKQILVEFDELHKGFVRSYLKAAFIIIRLKINNYKVVATDKYPDFLFVRD
tara:strand:- start:45862 stop:46638 length:777 start_codon:yes stop_codon:yes gene_type:complete